MWLPGGRRVTVYVPDRVSLRARRRLPLLVLHDGQNLFDPDRAFAGQHWRVGESADALIAGGAVAPMIICGVDHGGDQRIRELTPTPGAKRDGGGGIAHAAMLVTGLLPTLRREFPVSDDWRDLGLGGSSLGGLATLVTAVYYPRVFGRLLVMSPSVWWDRRAVLRLIAARPAGFADTRLWLDIGGREGAAAVSDVRRLARLLTSLKQARRARRLEMEVVEAAEADHSEGSWAARLPQALTYLFGTARS